MLKLQKNRDPGSYENSSVFWTGAECIIEGCTEMAGTAWDDEHCWRHNADRMDETVKIIKEIRRKLYAGELDIEEPEPEPSPVEKPVAVDPKQTSMLPGGKDFRRLINTLDPIMPSELDKYIKLGGHDGKPVPDIPAIRGKAAKIDSPDIELDWYPISQMVTDSDSNLYLARWLYEQKAGRP